jgi:hypothetical protein
MAEPQGEGRRFFQEARQGKRERCFVLSFQIDLKQHTDAAEAEILVLDAFKPCSSEPQGKPSYEAGFRPLILADAIKRQAFSLDSYFSFLEKGFLWLLFGQPASILLPGGYYAG